MTSVVRARLGLLGLLGAFLVPLWASSLNGGLTHVLTCRQAAKTPFTIEVPAHGDPVLSSALTLGRNQPRVLCGGLTLNIAAGPAGHSEVRVVLPIHNGTRYTWHGSVQLVIGGTKFPVGIGSVRAGHTASSSVVVHVDPGVHQLGGTLLIGP